MNPYQHFPTDRDIDPRPRSFPCHFCARDVASGQRCMCVPSKPRRVIPQDGGAAYIFVVR